MESSHSNAGDTTSGFGTIAKSTKAPDIPALRSLTVDSQELKGVRTATNDLQVTCDRLQEHLNEMREETSADSKKSASCAKWTDDILSSLKSWCATAERSYHTLQRGPASGRVDAAIAHGRLSRFLTDKSPTVKPCPTDQAGSHTCYLENEDRESLREKVLAVQKEAQEACTSLAQMEG